VVRNEKGLNYLSFQQGKHPLSIKAKWRRDHKILASAFEQIHACFEGELSVFDLPLAPVGTDFQKSVWSALMDIPYGHTASYGDIARAIGNPNACRAVGSANGKNPIPVIIPCHRVIGADGRLAGYGSGVEFKKKLLEIEGVKILS